MLCPETRKLWINAPCGRKAKPEPADVGGIAIVDHRNRHGTLGYGSIAGNSVALAKGVMLKDQEKFRERGLISPNAQTSAVCEILKVARR